MTPTNVPGADDGPAGSSHTHRMTPAKTTLTGRLIFIEPRPAGAVIDLLDERGHPFSVDVGLPWSAWALAAAGTLEMWAADHRRVALSFFTSRGTPRVSLSDDRYSIVLDLRAALDLSGQNNVTPQLAYR